MTDPTTASTAAATSAVATPPRVAPQTARPRTQRVASPEAPTWGGRLWPFFPVALLLGTVGGGAWAVTLAVNDPGFSLEPDYYEKAVAWDAHQAQVAANVELGWQVAVVADPGSAPGRKTLRARLSDKSGGQVSGAAVSVEAFPVARGDAILRAALPEAAPGSYELELPMERPGLWEVRLRAERGGRTFTSVSRVELTAPEGPVIELALSVVAASVVGSLHCVGMCGGVVAFYAAGEPQPGALLRAHAAYNLGRLVTYSVLGAAAGFVGAAVDLAGTATGVGQVAGVVAGALLIAWGLGALLLHLGVRLPRATVPVALERGVARWLARLRALPPATRAAALGLSSTLLPCGWLYAFALVAAGTAQPLTGALVMAAFWLGTVPAMVTVGVGLRALTARVRQHATVVAALSLVVVGALGIHRGVDVARIVGRTLDHGAPTSAPRAHGGAPLPDAGDAPCCH